MTAEERFWAKVDRRGPDECWPWTGAHTSTGVGNFWDGHAYVKAHRFAWELANGRAVPDGLMVSPQCRTKDCCNFAHLTVVTKHRVIVITGLTIAALNARKKQCDNGHKFTPENTRYKIRSDGRVLRECIECSREHNRRTVRRRSAERRAR